MLSSGSTSFLAVFIPEVGIRGLKGLLGFGRTLAFLRYLYTAILRCDTRHLPQYNHYHSVHHVLSKGNEYLSIQFLQTVVAFMKFAIRVSKAFVHSPSCQNLDPPQKCISSYSDHSSLMAYLSLSKLITLSLERNCPCSLFFRPLPKSLQLLGPVRTFKHSLNVKMTGNKARRFSRCYQ